MEFEDLSEEQIMREGWRLAAAVGRKSKRPPRIYCFGTGAPFVQFHYGPSGRKLATIIFLHGSEPRIILSCAGLSLHSTIPSRERRLSCEMARVLFKLVYDVTLIENRFAILSAHEKLELRLSVPREFWPQKWLDEEPE